MNSLEEYKNFIDRFVEISDSSMAKWSLSGRFPDTAENESINGLLSELDESQRTVVAELIETAKFSGIHDALAILNEEQLLNNLSILKNGKQLPVEPFGTEMHFDYVSRIKGDDWPG